MSLGEMMMLMGVVLLVGWDEWSSRVGLYVVAHDTSDLGVVVGQKRGGPK
jgi:hypothetical protein